MTGCLTIARSSQPDSHCGCIKMMLAASDLTPAVQHTHNTATQQCAYIPGTVMAGQNAICSCSAKKLSMLVSSTIFPIVRIGRRSVGHSCGIRCRVNGSRTCAYGHR